MEFTIDQENKGVSSCFKYSNTSLPPHPTPSLKRLRIGIIGCYGGPNFGDQLLFNILLGWINEICPHAEIVVPWGDIKGIQWPRHIHSVDQGMNELLQADAAIFAGGGYLGDRGKHAFYFPGEESRVARLIKHIPSFLFPNYIGSELDIIRATKGRYKQYYTIAQELQDHQIPYSIIGVGVGPVSSSLGQKYVASVLKGAQYISLRDKESCQYANFLLPNRHNDVIETADMVLTLIKPAELRGYSGVIGLHLGPVDGTYLAQSSEYSESMRNAVAVFVNQGFKIKCISDSVRCALPFFSQLRKLFPHAIEVLPYETPESFIETIRRCDVIWTTKLHAGIIAYAENVLPFATALHVKTQRVYDQAALGSNCLPFSVEAITRTQNNILEMLKSPHHIVDLLSEKREALRDAAFRNREVLKAFLSSLPQNLNQFEDDKVRDHLSTIYQGLT
jgi:polysaccharide pyruvyl transferase WcaK-like protein